MREYNPNEFANSSGWHVKQDPGTLLYVIQADNGKRKASKYTDRRTAEAALAGYLQLLSTESKKANAKKEARKKAAATQEPKTEIVVPQEEE